LSSNEEDKVDHIVPQFESNSEDDEEDLLGRKNKKVRKPLVQRDDIEIMDLKS